MASKEVIRQKLTDKLRDTTDWGLGKVRLFESIKTEMAEKMKLDA